MLFNPYGKKGGAHFSEVPMVPCGSSPVARLYLSKNEAPEEEVAGGRGGGVTLP